MFGDMESQRLLLWVLVPVAIAAAVSVHWFIRTKAQRFVRGRPRLSSAEFAALFGTQAEAALAPVIRDRLRGHIPVDPALVRPDDKLCDELQLAATDGLDANAFMMEVEKAVGLKIPDQEARRMLTLREIVSYAAAHQHGRSV